MNKRNKKKQQHPFTLNMNAPSPFKNVHKLLTYNSERTQCSAVQCQPHEQYTDHLVRSKFVSCKTEAIRKYI